MESSQLIMKRLSSSSSSSSMLFPLTAKKRTSIISKTKFVTICSSLGRLPGAGGRVGRRFKRQPSAVAVAVRLEKPPRQHKTRFWCAYAADDVSAELSYESTAVSLLESFLKNIDVFSRFARLNVIIGTAVGIVSMCFLAVEKMSDISPLFFTGMLQANVAAAFMNIYVVALNQLCDIAIDKVNKPHLPLASGEYSTKTGTLIVVFAAIMGLSIPIFVGSWPLFCALFIRFVLGIAYSVNLPLLRWKRSALITAIIMVVGKPITQVASYLHMQTHVFGRTLIFPKALIFTVTFMSFFSVVFALFKDIPDVAGDTVDGVQSLALLLGQKRVFWICVSLLEIAYVGATLIGVLICSNRWAKYIMVIGHAAMGLLLWNRVKVFNHSGPPAYESFYMFIWKLYCAEYFLIQFVR